MAVIKALPRVRQPFSVIHRLLVSHGFRKVSRNQEVVYRVCFEDTSVRTGYFLHIPCREDRSGDTLLLGEAFFEQESVPASVLEAARSKLMEISDYLRNEMTAGVQNNKETENGSMTATNQ